jgi:hypothetical protein
MQAAVEAERGTQTPAATATVTQGTSDKPSTAKARPDKAGTDKAGTDSASTDSASTDKAGTDSASTGTGRANPEAASASDESPGPITEPLARVRVVTDLAQIAAPGNEQSPRAANGTTAAPVRPGPPWPAQHRPADRDRPTGDRPADRDRPAALDRAIVPRRRGRLDRGALPRRDTSPGRLAPPSRSVPRRPAEPDQPATTQPGRPRAALPAPAAPAPTAPAPAARDKQPDRSRRPAQKKRSAQPKQSAKDTDQAQTGWPAQGGWPAETGPAPTETPDRPAGRKARASRPRVVGVAAVAIVLVAAGTLAAVLTSRAQAPKTAANRTARPGTAVSRAANWVASQVSHSAVVACDHIMCRALTSARFPEHNLQPIGPTSPYPVHADVVVVTPEVQRQFGSSLAAQVAPSIMAQFGKGAATISIRVVARQGAAAYKSALAADLRLRRVGGAALLASHQVTASALARKDLLSGRVDARLIVVLTALASVHPVDIVGFGTVFKGTSADIPFRMADVAADDAAAKLNSAAYVAFLKAVINEQPTEYAPQTAGPLPSDGQSVFQIQFSAPSPLGLLAAQGP